jgi:EAL domain-containing protein (putative c-di-GMP-specific phosphodiesterase class I)
VLYQPQVDLSSGRISGVEALVRWDHPDAGLLSPAEFLPLAETCGAIVAIDDLVLRQACADLASWRDAGHAELRVAVNMSVRSLEDPLLLTRLEAIRASRGVGSGQLEV